MANSIQPFEFTPEINDRFAKYQERKMRTANDATLAGMRSGMLSRNLTGDTGEFAGMARVKSAGDQEINDMMARLGYTGAGMAREERMTNEGRAYGTGEREATQAYNTAEAEKNRNFQEKMLQLEYKLRQQLMDAQSPSFLEGLVPGVLQGGMSLGSSLIGANALKGLAGTISGAGASGGFGSYALPGASRLSMFGG